jgi:hypothetical protein
MVGALITAPRLICGQMKIGPASVTLSGQWQFHTGVCADVAAAARTFRLGQTGALAQVDGTADHALPGRSDRRRYVVSVLGTRRPRTHLGGCDHEQHLHTTEYVSCRCPGRSAGPQTESCQPSACTLRGIEQGWGLERTITAEQRSTARTARRDLERNAIGKFCGYLLVCGVNNCLYHSLRKPRPGHSPRNPDLGFIAIADPPRPCVAGSIVFTFDEKS